LAGSSGTANADDGSTSGSGDDCGDDRGVGLSNFDDAYRVLSMAASSSPASSHLTITFCHTSKQLWAAVKPSVSSKNGNSTLVDRILSDVDKVIDYFAGISY